MKTREQLIEALRIATTDLNKLRYDMMSSPTLRTRDYLNEANLLGQIKALELALSRDPRD